MVRKCRSLEYEEPVTPVEFDSHLGGEAGRRLRRRIEQSGHFSIDMRSWALIEQATGFLAETFDLPMADARDILIQDAAARGLTMTEAAERILSRPT